MPIGPFKRAPREDQPSIGALALLHAAVLGLLDYSCSVMMDFVAAQSGGAAPGAKSFATGRSFITATILCGIYVSVIIWWGIFWRSKPRSANFTDQTNRCLRCGYLRDGLEPGAKCPECGLDSSGLVRPRGE